MGLGATLPRCSSGTPARCDSLLCARCSVYEVRGTGEEWFGDGYGNFFRVEACCFRMLSRGKFFFFSLDSIVLP